jgi:hypothetical protein
LRETGSSLWPTIDPKVDLLLKMELLSSCNIEESQLMMVEAWENGLMN